jgi:hypothetical protein
LQLQLHPLKQMTLSGVPQQAHSSAAQSEAVAHLAQSMFSKSRALYMSNLATSLVRLFMFSHAASQLIA